MKPSSNSISGIKMSSNVNHTMKRNDVLFEVNNLVCYMPKTEPRVQSCGAMNMQQKLMTERLRGISGEKKSQPRGRSDLACGSRTAARVRRRVRASAELDGGGGSGAAEGGARGG